MTTTTTTTTTATNHPNDHHVDDDDHHDVKHTDDIPFYCRPKQRQKWGDHQIHPHANWGDTFFDLFYVAAAYNLGTLIRSEPTSKGILYFLGCFFPIYLVWNSKMYFDSRFYIPNDLFHRGYEFAMLVSLATAVLYIRPVSILSNNNNNYSVDMFAFALAVTITSLLSSGRLIEVVLFLQHGEQHAAKVAARRDLMWYSISILLFLAATIVSGIQYYTNNNNNNYDTASDYGYYDDHYYDGTKDSSSKESNYSSSASTGDTTHNNNYEEDSTKDDHHRTIFRFMAETTTTTTTSDYSTTNNGNNDIPIWLILSGCIWNVISLALIILTLPGNGKHKEVTVPMNINFAIHRFGAFTMLMLGESVLSLLIVDVTERTEYYKTFFGGIISITLLEFLHFRSQPHHPDDHALRRTKEAGVVFSFLMQIYSAALVVLGTSYKMLLYEYVFEEEEASKLTTTTTISDEYEYDNYSSTGDNSHRRKLLFSTIISWDRSLAAAGGGDDGPKFDTFDRRQRVAHLFCGSMAIVWICLDGMILAHRGLKDNLGRCRCEQSGSVRYLSILLLMTRIGLIVFIATLSQYVTSPDVLALIGLLGIMSQVLLRVAGTSLFGEDFREEHNDDHGHGHDDVHDDHGHGHGHDNHHGNHEDINEEVSSSFWPNRTIPQTLPEGKKV